METLPYQQEAITWMLRREQDRACRGGFLCHEMGLGKTFMMSTVIKSNPQRTVIFAPKSTLTNWCETLRIVSQFAFNVQQFDKDMVLDPARPVTVVATHQAILRNLQWFIDRGFHRMIIDEAHVMRNPGSKLTLQFGQLARSVSVRWGITATPFNNTDKDIAVYVRYLFPHAAGLVPTDIFRWVMLRKTRADVFPEGPKLTVTKQVYDFEHPEEKRLYEVVSQRIDEQMEWINANRGHLPRHVIGAMIILVMLRQRQATIHPQIVLNAERRWRRLAEEQGEDVQDWNKTRVTKVNRIIEMIHADQKQTKSTMVITHFGDEINLIAERLAEKNIPYKILNGKTKQNARRAIETHGNPVSEFSIVKHIDKACTKLGVSMLLPAGPMRNILAFVQRPTVVLLQIQAGGVGISLPWVHHVINTSPDWNPFLERQAIFRAYRLTTKHNVHVTQMYLRDTIDKQIHTKQVQKLMRSLYWTGDSEASVEDFIEQELMENDE